MKLLARPVGMIIVVLLLNYLDVITLTPIKNSEFLTGLIIGPFTVIVSFLIWIIPMIGLGFGLEILAGLYSWSDQTRELIAGLVVIVGSVLVNWLSFYSIGTLTKWVVVPTFPAGGLEVGLALSVPVYLIIIYDWVKKYM